MNNEEVRRQLLDGIDSLIEAPKIVAWMIKPDKMRLLRALRNAVSQANDAVLTWLGGFIAREPQYRGVEDVPVRGLVVAFIVSELSIEEGGKLAANLLDVLNGMKDGATAVHAFSDTLSEEVTDMLQRHE